MSAKAPPFPGFTAFSDQIFSRPGETISTAEQAQARSSDPTVVLLYGWGDGLAKHVVKYADGYRVLFPHATQVVILSPMTRVLFADLQQRSAFMTPVLKAVFDTPDVDASRILVQAMSNMGAINYGATLHAYQQRHGHAMPHELLVMDSSPGSTELSWDNTSRWSRAMALGTAAWFPWPFVITQAIWAAFLLLHGAIMWTIGRESAGHWTVRAITNTLYEVKYARRLYLYSKEDDLILCKDVERNIAETQRLGRSTDVELFCGSGHVGHMKMFPQQYWGAIRRNWAAAVTEQSRSTNEVD